jgi:hypothetical protein
VYASSYQNTYYQSEMNFSHDFQEGGYYFNHKDTKVFIFLLFATLNFSSCLCG